MSADAYSDVQVEYGPDADDSGYNRLALFLTENDALNLYKALNGVQFHDARAEHLTRMIEHAYNRAFGTELTEPWEWNDE